MAVVDDLNGRVALNKLAGGSGIRTLTLCAQSVFNFGCSSVAVEPEGS